MKSNDVFAALKRYAVKEVFAELALDDASWFSDECDQMIRDDAREKERLRKYKIKRDRNALVAHRIYKRYVAVTHFDPWKATEDYPPDVFGDNFPRIEAIKSLENRKLRILWCLWSICHLMMFDEPAKGSKRYGKKYSKYRRLWYKHEEVLAEKIRQDKWDRKRAKVRARRQKQQEKKNDKPIIKRTRVQRVIEELEPTKDLPNI